MDSDPISFPCACWLAEDVWDSKTERELLPGKAVRRPESMIIVLLAQVYCRLSIHFKFRRGVNFKALKILEIGF